MNDEIITLTISGNGQIEIDTKGFTGKTCEATASKILMKLNGTTTEEKRKDEYWADGDDPVKVLNL